MEAITIQSIMNDLIITIIITVIISGIGLAVQKFKRKIISFKERSISYFRLLDNSAKVNSVIFVVFISICLIIITLNLHDSGGQTDLEDIVPQLYRIPGIYTATYAANGEALFYNDNKNDDRDKNVKLVFINDDKNVESNCGFMIAGLKGYNAEDFDNLSFYAKGQNGGEVFGIKMKDLDNKETGFNVTKYIDNKKITKIWGLVDIPLYNFGKVDRSRIECITLYTDGEMSGKNRTIIYIKSMLFTK